MHSINRTTTAKLYLWNILTDNRKELWEAQPVQDIVEDGQVDRHRLTAAPCKTPKWGVKFQQCSKSNATREDFADGLAYRGREGLDAVVLDENEEGVLHLPRRELEAADDLMQRQRAVAQEAAAHLLRKGNREW